MASHFIRPPVSTTRTILGWNISVSSFLINCEPRAHASQTWLPGRCQHHGSWAWSCSVLYYSTAALFYCTLWSGDCYTALCGLVTAVLHFVVWWLLYCTLWSGDCCTALCGLVTDCSTALCGLVTDCSTALCGLVTHCCSALEIWFSFLLLFWIGDMWTMVAITMTLTPQACTYDAGGCKREATGFIPNRVLVMPATWNVTCGTHRLPNLRTASPTALSSRHTRQPCSSPLGSCWHRKHATVTGAPFAACLLADVECRTASGARIISHFTQQEWLANIWPFSFLSTESVWQWCTAEGCVARWKYERGWQTRKGQSVRLSWDGRCQLAPPAVQTGVTGAGPSLFAASLLSQWEVCAQWFILKGHGVHFVFPLGITI